MPMVFVVNRENPPLCALLTAETVKQSLPTKIDWGNETVLKVSHGISLSKSHTISRYLARSVPSCDLYGATVLERTEIDHWLTFSSGPLQCPQEFPQAVLYLNNVLAPSTYLVGNKVTLADYAVWATLYSNPQWKSISTSDLTNLSRWYEFLLSTSLVSSVINIIPPMLVKQQSNVLTTTTGKKDEGKFIDLPGAEVGKVVVRFPPEASGYLHIGHAKAALLNQYYQENFKGKLVMRFDDTNPAKEKVDFEKVILEDLKLLQIKPDVFSHTSDYFDLMIDMCEKLILEGKAYADDTGPEQMKLEREQKVESRNRNNSVEQNMQMWNEMKKGTSVGQKYCIRAKMDMNSVNGCMRDPTMYRCKNEPHPKTGTKYKVYPTYDFACPIVDSIEGVTHCLRTTEYHDRDEQFYWFIDAMGLRKPYVWEYSRLNMTNTVLSKRKLTWFVENGFVDGWDDPRFPTVRGILRHGMTVEGLKQFIISQGSSRSVVLMEWDKIWAINKKVIDPIAPRYTAVLKDGTVSIRVSNVTEAPLIVQKHPKNQEVGTKTIWVGPNLLIDSEDVTLLKEGENATFINWGNLLIKKINRENGKVISIDVEPNLDNKDYKKTPKLTWLAVSDKVQNIPCVCVYFDHILSKAILGKDEDFKDFINPNTKIEVEMIGDPELAKVKKGEIIQLQRKGFFICDRPYRPPSAYTSCKGPIILFFIPDGHTKEMPTVSAAKKQKEAGLKETLQQTRPAESKLTSNLSEKLKTLLPQIQSQENKLQDLKSRSVAQAVIDEETKSLEKLKSDFKIATGEDWKPNCVLSSFVFKAVPVQTVDSSSEAVLLKQISDQEKNVEKLRTESADVKIIEKEVAVLLTLKSQLRALSGERLKIDFCSENSTQQNLELNDNANSFIRDKLLHKISVQGSVVRKLKTDKAAKSTIDVEVKNLLELKKQFKEVTGEEWKPELSPSKVTGLFESQSDLQGNNTRSDLLQKISDQGGVVRNLKSQKAAKSTIDNEVTKLLELKSEFKRVTGEEWTAQLNSKNANISQDSSINLETSEVRNNLLEKIALQGDLVRKLKAEKAKKDTIDIEVKKLLELKAEFKTVTGEDWKVDLYPKRNSDVDKLSIITTNSGAVNSILEKIANQGDVVRKLKSQKVDKNLIDTEVKRLLELKADFKSLTGEEWKLDFSKKREAEKMPVTENNDSMNGVADLTKKITDQGNKVRQLKSSGVSKENVDAEVKILLALKSQYKEMTGNVFPTPGEKSANKKDNKADKAKKEKTKQETKAKSVAPVKQEVKDIDQAGIKKQTRLGLEARKEDNLPEWYTQVITKGELIEYYDVSGCYIFRPWSYAIWEAIKEYFDAEIKKLGVQNCYFPLFVSRGALEKEKTHIADFSPEVAWITRYGETDLAEPIAVRPTSETVMYPAYAKWIQSYRDLPIKLNQWNNVVRWEFKHPQPFLRTREFLWQEGHTAYATFKDASQEVKTILDLYANIYTDLLAIPVIKGRKTEKEKFAGGNYTLTVEAFISASGRAIQGATSHHLGQNFSKMFDIVFEDPETQEKKFVFQNSWGITTRTIGVMVMVHADNQGLVLPPHVATIQVVIVPCGITVNMKEEEKKELLSSCGQLENELRGSGIRVYGDYRENYSPGWRFNHWELKGVPVRIEIGPKDLKQNQVVAVRRDTGEKVAVPRVSITKDVTDLLEKIHYNLFQKAKEDLDKHIKMTSDWNEFCHYLEGNNLIYSPFCGKVECEEKIRKDSTRDEADVEPGALAMGAKGLCIPIDQPGDILPDQKCFHPSCQNQALFYTLFGRSY